MLKTLGDRLIHFNVVKKVCLFPVDVTPTGSLRRRRSRVPSEEDESTLMEFLHASGQNTNRERKSWGSLGNMLCCLNNICYLNMFSILVILLFCNSEKLLVISLFCLITAPRRYID